MKCPKCDQTLFWDDVIDTESDTEKIVEHLVGHCPICETNYSWRRVYTYEMECGLFNEDE